MFIVLFFHFCVDLNFFKVKKILSMGIIGRKYFFHPLFMPLVFLHLVIIPGSKSSALTC